MQDSKFLESLSFRLKIFLQKNEIVDLRRNNTRLATHSRLINGQRTYTLHQLKCLYIVQMEQTNG